MNIEEIMRLSRVIAVLAIEDPGHARRIATALVAGGVRAVEVTLRTNAALEVIREMAAVPEAVVGAGTVLNEAQLHAAVDAGARFIVSPGLTEPLARAAGERTVPFLPGVATASDLMRGLALGLGSFKFFPAEAAGGIAALKALAGPFADVRFCPTGGIREETMAKWLDLPQVLCVGGSWIVPDETASAERITDAASRVCARALATGEGRVSSASS